MGSGTIRKPWLIFLFLFIVQVLFKYRSDMNMIVEEFCKLFQFYSESSRN